MKTNLAALVAGMALVCALSACGGGGDGGGNLAASPATPTTPVPAPDPTLKPVLIEMYGDSTTQGQDVLTESGTVTKASEPLALQSLLQGRFGSSVTISNQGVSGTEASQLLNGTDTIHPSWINQMAVSKAQIVTLNFALNDAFYSIVATPGHDQESPSQFADDLTQMVEIARAAGKQVVLFEPNPVTEPIRSPILAQYVSAIQQVARSKNIPIAKDYESMLALPNWQSLLADTLHPTEPGYQQKASFEFPVLAPLVEGCQAPS
ncbi:SGNH/GDSL hydrolase family protein [Burkholderia vietnamiensis]|uniref:SGNH/GDSL hydrolase family protein n=1 Tax=Burkholderia vietnamiensis TaxID=60552 RepID=UPI001B9B9C45|nr:SGNH/GDSL hydrolase family protein [Burkholderia vietnamiensis]MBR7998254.1 SGNH/GDSL hydrolase family protein [Burkholderia vietnamiensis]